jgi:membrane-associated phospholipid phosphatase
VRTPERLRFGAPLAAIVAALTTAVAHAQSEPADGLRYDLRVDIPVTAGAVGVGIAMELLKDALAPRSCRVCGVDGLDAVARGALRWNDTGAANTLSNWTGFVLTPVTALAGCEVAAAADHRFHDAPSNALVVVEATALAVALDDAVKLLVARQRPYAHFRDPGEPAPPDTDENLSFYSGHTNLAFAVAVASGTVASMRGYRLASVVWATSLPMAAATGYLRIAADKHYLTDVLTGALIGSAVGFLVPFAFHRAPATAVDPVATGAMPVLGRGPFVTNSWTF